MPFTLRRVLERVTRQVGQSHVYSETAAYSGPDRRDRLNSLSENRQARFGGLHRRIEIVRNLVSGVTVLRDDHVASAA